MVGRTLQDFNRIFLIEYGVRKSHLKEIINSGWIKFRNGVDEFLEFLHNHDIPLVIMSADGCGEAIPMFFEKNNKNYSNIYYIVNRFIWSKDGKAIGVKKPVIHSMNKDEMILRKMPEIYISIKNRRNIILLGDSLSDIGMVKGFRYKNLMKIGFLNFEEDRLRGEYAKSFDVVIEGDGDFGFVNKIIKSLAD
ncbi:MAG: hypothetical protein N3E38_01240 [Candidatus Aenigmarchaeota archaeon]|nr:hypothetical protein [Candidatus Aenigmarchaeota archaeon]